MNSLKLQNRFLLSVSLYVIRASRHEEFGALLFRVIGRNDRMADCTFVGEDFEILCNKNNIEVRKIILNENLPFARPTFPPWNVLSPKKWISSKSEAAKN